MKETNANLVVATSSEAVLLTEHYSQRVLFGDAENIRANLKYALEKLNYFIESEQPSLIAKRKTQLSDYGGKLLAGNVLPFVKRLQIPLSPVTENSTVANFGYAVMNSSVTKGDRQTIEREIDALVALASSRRLQAPCPACGANNTKDSRFCRVCGIPNIAGEPAELEVLRLTANARAAHQKIVGGAIFVLCWITVFLPLWLLSQQGALIAAVMLSGGTLFGLLWSLSGIARLHRTLNPSSDARKTLASAQDSSRKIPSAQIDSLPSQPSNASVTERTTKLLNPLHKKDGAIDECERTSRLQ